MKLGLQEVGSRLRREWSVLEAQIKSNYRVQLGLLCILGLTLVYIFLVMSDVLEVKNRRLLQIQSEIKRVGDVSRGQSSLASQAELLAREKERLNIRLGGYATDAIAQAAMAEWISSIFKQLNIQVPTVSQVTIQPIPGGLKGPAGEVDTRFRELRTSVAFPYSAAALMGVLSVIEGGQQRLTSVENLNVTTQRVEMGIRLLTRVGPDLTNAPESHSEPAIKPSSSQVFSQPAELLSAPVAAPAVPVDKILWN